MEILLRRQSLGRNEHGYSEWQVHEEKTEIDPARTALILCDVWDRHWSRAANERLAPMLPDMARVVAALRAKGAFVIHAPSDTMDHYKGTPARARMQRGWPDKPAVLFPQEDPPQPVDASDGGSDSCEPDDQIHRQVWTRQHPQIPIDMERDGISDDGGEVYGALKARGIKRVMMMGVHTNMCILNRSFAIKNLVRWGFCPALIRDLTDLMYNPAMPPYVSHAEALALTLGYIEKFWCPTLESAGLLRP